MHEQPSKPEFSGFIEKAPEYPPELEAAIDEMMWFHFALDGPVIQVLEDKSKNFRVEETLMHILDFMEMPFAARLSNTDVNDAKVRFDFVHLKGGKRYLEHKELKGQKIAPNPFKRLAQFSRALESAQNYRSRLANKKLDLPKEA